ncbi:hypothetical protein CLU79DRAFT_714468 [Phycomyces nitens]|nr:hypothetical protein CLU79DRAFT_714468 [Phycomyces nitens]
MSTPEGSNSQGSTVNPWQVQRPAIRAQNTASRPKNKYLYIFTAPGFDQNLSMDPASAAWVSTIHSLSILFNLGKLVPASAVDDVLSENIGQMSSLTLCYTRSKDLLVEALFIEPATRVEATSDGLVYQNTRIVASPSLFSHSYIVKVDMYRISAYDLKTALLGQVEEAFQSYGKVVQLRAYVSHC